MVPEVVTGVWVDEDAGGFQSIGVSGANQVAHDRGPRFTASQVNKVPVSSGVRVSTSNMATGWGPIGFSWKR